VVNTFIGEIEKVSIREKPMFLWGKGTAVYDGKGGLFAAIETITVVEQHQASQSNGESENEIYIGGISSPTLKVAGGSASGSIWSHPSPPGIWHLRNGLLSYKSICLSKPRNLITMCWMIFLVQGSHR
jgi:hypothetical protein